MPQPNLGSLLQQIVAKDPVLVGAAQKLLCSSDYAARQFKHLQQLLSQDNCQYSLEKNDYHRLVEQLSLNLSLQAFSTALRHFRHYHLLRLLLREMAHLSDTIETMSAWSDCADALIQHALRYCEFQLLAKFGRPRHDSGALAQLYTIAMGKLGGRELNYSSDIDLIFAFSAAGFTDGVESISNQQYYTKVVQQFMQLLQTVTVEGFVFRVDVRLRPNGDSGPLVYSLTAMETYYQEQGRDWERYAMVKARLIAADEQMQQWFNRFIKPFVYRRYVDFSVIESLRSMKAMIEREIKLNPMLDDIKRGQGGIREVEFIIQSFQLIRGGRLPQIQHQNAMQALHALKKQGILPHRKALQRAYLFLRKLENALQAQNDQQTQRLPKDPNIQSQILIAMELAHWNDLVSELHKHQRVVSRIFHAVLSKVDAYQEDKKRLLTSQLSNIWQGHVEMSMAINLLTSLGYQDAERCYQLIYAFHNSPRCRRLSQAARILLDRFMVLLLIQLTQVQNNAKVLLQVLNLLENIVGRSAYLALLTENLPVLQELLHWFAHSPFMSSLFVAQPFLLEILIDQKQSWRPLSRKQLKLLLQSRLMYCEEEESLNESLRQFKLTCWLLAARAELYGQCHAIRIGQFLSDVTEVIITEVLSRACQLLSLRYPEFKQLKSRFAIIAYGKLGSREMNYDSDIDLVFLHNATTPAEEASIIRLTQKILHMLTNRSQTGVLYNVDTRLRPSGTAGLLVSHIDAFVDYQKTRAWTWEHQALLRARTLFANAMIKTTFNQLKQNVIFLPRDKTSLRDDVTNMRAKINKHLEHDAIKHVSGGLLDLEFLVLILAHPDSKITSKTQTLAQLKNLLAQQVLSAEQFRILRRAYRAYHRLSHHYLLKSHAIVRKSQQEEVAAICDTFYSSSPK